MFDTQCQKIIHSKTHSSIKVYLRIYTYTPSPDEVRCRIQRNVIEIHGNCISGFKFDQYSCSLAMPDISNIDFLYKSNFHYKSKMNEWVICKPLYQIRRGYVFVIVIVKYFRNAKEYVDNITNTSIPTIQPKEKKMTTNTETLNILLSGSVLLFTSQRGNFYPEFWNLLSSSVFLVPFLCMHLPFH